MTREVKTGPLAVAALSVGILLAGCGGSGLPATADKAPQRGTSPSQGVSGRPALTLVARWSAARLGLNNPRSIAMAPSGNVYIADDSQRITEVSPHGGVIRRWGSPGSGPGEFHFIATDVNDPRDVHESLTVAPSGRVYVSDSGNARVEVFNADGRYLRQFGHFGVGRGQFLLPASLVADSDGNVYVTDDNRKNLTKFSPSGTPICTVGSSAGDPDFEGHLHVSSIDVHGRLVVANDDNGRVLYLDADGHKVDAFTAVNASGDHDVCDVVVDATGRTYFTGCPGPVAVLDRNHRLIGSWDPPVPLLCAPRLGSHHLAYTLGDDQALMVLRLNPMGG